MARLGAGQRVGNPDSFNRYPVRARTREGKVNAPSTPLTQKKAARCERPEVWGGGGGSVGLPGKPETHSPQRKNNQDDGYACVHDSPGLEGRDNANASDTSDHEENEEFSHMATSVKVHVWFFSSMRHRSMHPAAKKAGCPDFVLPRLGMSRRLSAASTSSLADRSAIRSASLRGLACTFRKRSRVNSGRQAIKKFFC